MRTLATATATQVDSDAPIGSRMVLFDFPSGLHGFWEGVGDLPWNGVTFRGSGSLIDIEFGDEALGSEANGFSLKLRSNPDAGITSDVLATFFSESYHLRPVTIYEVWFTPNTMAIAGNPVVMASGIISTVEMRSDDSGAYLFGTCETDAVLHTSRGTAKACHAEQLLVSPGDMFFEFTGIVGAVQMPFGRKLDSSAAAKAPTVLL